MKVKDARFEDVCKFGLYSIGDASGEICVCNMCGIEYRRVGYILSHIMEEHIDDEIPDVDPAGEEVGCVKED